MSLINSTEKNEMETLSFRVKLVKEETDWEDNNKDEFHTKGNKKDFEDVNKNFKLEDGVFMKEETKEFIEEQFELKCDNDTSQFSSSIHDKNYILKNIPRKKSEEVNKGGKEVYSMLSDDNEVKFSETKEYKMDYSNWEEGYVKEEIKFEEHIPYIESKVIPSSGCGSLLDAERVDVEKEYTAYLSLPPQECSTVKFSCSDCNMDFKLRCELKFHTFREHNKQLKYHCTICRDSFNLKRNLIYHLGFCHKSSLEVKEKEYSCSECSERFRIPSELKIHKDMFHKSDKFKCSYCSLTFDKKTSLRSHIISHKGIFKHKHICEVCGKVFSFQSNLARHVKIHSDPKAHSCDTCGKGFSRLEHLKLHQKMQKHIDLMGESQKNSKIHADNNTVDMEEFVCNICGFGFRVKQRLRDHLKLHSEKRPHVCPVCNRAFKQIYNLKQHLLSHDGPRDFVCDVCKKGFRRKAFLKQHMLVHTKEKNYMCEVCGKRYYKSCHVAAHKKVAHEVPKVK